MNIGITGQDGFIGSHLLNHLKIAMPSENLETFDRRKYDLLAPNSLKSFVQDKDIIFHLAGKNIAEPFEFITVNMLGTINLLEAIRKSSSNKLRIIFASTFQVYGLSKSIKKFKEGDVCVPTNVFGLSKKLAEESIVHYNTLYGINSIILRLSNVYGPGCRPYYNSVIATFIDILKNNGEIRVDGDGSQGRDFIYIRDVVNAFMKTIPFNKKDVEVFNICTGEVISVNQLIEILENLTKKHAKIIYNMNKVNKNFLIGNPKKAKDGLGFESEFNLKEGLSKTLGQLGIG